MAYYKGLFRSAAINVFNKMSSQEYHEDNSLLIVRCSDLHVRCLLAHNRQQAAGNSAQCRALLCAGLHGMKWVLMVIYTTFRCHP